METDKEWVKMLQEQEDKSKAWKKCEEDFSKFRKQFCDTKTEWHYKQKKREQIQEGMVKVVETKRFRINIMTLGLSHLLGYTSEILTKFNHDIDRAESMQQGATLHSTEIVEFSKFAEKLEHREEELQSLHDELKRRKYELEHHTRKLKGAVEVSDEVHNKLEKAKKDTKCLDIEMEACIQRIDNIKKQKEKFIKEAQLTLTELCKCENNLSAITSVLEDSQTRVQDCIEQLQAKSDSLKMADIVVAPVARCAQAVGMLTGATAKIATLGLADIDIEGYGKTAKSFIDGGLPEEEERLRNAEKQLKESDNTLERLKHILGGCNVELKRMHIIIDKLKELEEPNIFFKALANLYKTIWK